MSTLLLKGMELTGVINPVKQPQPPLPPEPKFKVAQKQEVANSTVNGFGFTLDGYNDMIAVGSYPATRVDLYQYDQGTDTWILNWTKNKSGMRFGFSLSLSDEWLVVSDAPTSGNGSVYIYRKVSGAFETTEFQTITNPDGALGPGFGYGVAIDGTTLVIGHIDGMTHGGVHVYTFDGNTWVRQGGFISPEPNSTRAGSNQNLGYSVSISGNNLIAGGSGDILGIGLGMAMVSKRTGLTWSNPVLLAPETTYADGFGYSVKAKGNKLIVGSPNGNAVAGHSGRVFVYDFTSTPVLEETLTVGLTSSSTIIDATMGANDRLGWAVDISDDLSVVAAGATQKSTNAGAVYLFEKVGNFWQGAPSGNNGKISQLPAASNNRFGSSVKLIQNGVTVGAYGKRSVYWFNPTN